MTAPIKHVPDCTVYVEQYAAFLLAPTNAEERRFDGIFSKLSVSQSFKVILRAQTIVREALGTS